MPQSLKAPQLYVNTHFNHPNEITEESFNAIKIIRELGIPMHNQTVLLKGVNDDTDVMRDLVHGLGKMGVKPIERIEGKQRTERGRTKRTLMSP